MIKIFIRSIFDDHVECSFYDKNGKRYLKMENFATFNKMNAKEVDDVYGHYA